MYCVQAQKRASGAPRIHFRACKISKFPGGAPPDPPSQNPFCEAPLFVFALGPPNPLGGPAHKHTLHTQEYPLHCLPQPSYMHTTNTRHSWHKSREGGKYCGDIPTLFGWFLRVPSLHVLVFIQCDLRSLYLWFLYLPSG